ncbi:MAG: ATP-dependent DNA helicase PcrA [SAR202 cluster bacterium]|nr:ATP-dependent DNA helicase PcrA [SAR202 cluster bacterium]OUU75678.1 MAG: hypothetical protein CBC30_04735 [Chloroflexi bacterium TMED70]RZP16712.1 MAG: ATP-dependent DNA helicase PcrA [Chloroflexota bacterium]|tara:strand:- start:5548 stop:7800 length:2253 start_codon:yes stop_codon:yes gene_type:complete
MDDLNEKILEGLSDNQSKAVTHDLKPLLVIAGPGSGKTRVMAHRIPWIVNNFQINPNQILAVTFTNKAAKELMARANRFLPNYMAPLVKTFHGFSSYFLRIEGFFAGLDQSFSIYDDTDQIRIIKNIFDELDLNPRKINPKVIAAEISKAKNKGFSPNSLKNKNSSYFDEIVSRIYSRYQEIIDQSNACDFDDLLMKTKMILVENEDIKEKWASKYKQVIIDEFQDTNPLQFEISNLLTNSQKSISVVGDPDQSIYSWRHAVPTNLLEFQKQYKECLVVNLDESYRSTQQILDAADSIISNNSNRFKRKLWTKKKNGSLINFNFYNDEEEESLSVASKISKQIKNGISSNEIAIIYRVNAQSRVFEVALNSLGLKYRLVGGVRFYDRKEIKDILAYCKLLVNPNDDNAFERIVNCPPRGIGNKTLQVIRNSKIDENLSFINYLKKYINNEDFSLLSKRATTALKDFIIIYNKLLKQTEIQEPFELINSIITLTSYDDYLRNDEDGSERLENINELKSSAEEFSVNVDKNPKESLIEFIETASLNTNLDNMNESFEAVTLITLHQAKGLEYEKVFIVGMEEGLLPHSRSLESEDEIEEERRLCYVGITRAKNELYLSASSRRRFQGVYGNAIKSRFLEEIPKDVILTNSGRNFSQNKTHWKSNYIKQNIITEDDFDDNIDQPEININKGDKVSHKTFGEGILISYKPLFMDIELTVKFEEPTGMKKIMKNKAPIKITKSSEESSPEDYYGI